MPFNLITVGQGSKVTFGEHEPEALYSGKVAVLWSSEGVLLFKLQSGTQIGRFSKSLVHPVPAKFKIRKVFVP